MSVPEFCVLVEPHTGAGYADLLAVARRVESLGLTGLFVSDHYFCPPELRAGPWTTDVWITLAGLARDSAEIRLGSLVSAATFRHPVALAVQAAQVDAMSGGRLEVGIGAAWWQAEHEAFGLDFPSPPERFDRLAEQLEIVTGLWATAPNGTFEHAGPHYRLATAPGVGCLRPGGPPIVIGGSGPRRTPALAARYAAEFNSGWRSPAGTRHEFDRVAAACRAVGRDPATLRRSSVQTLCLGRTDDAASRRAAALGLDTGPDTGPTGSVAAHPGLIGGPARVADRIAAFAEAGADRIYLELPDLSDLGQLDLFAAAVRPRLDSWA